MGVAGLRKFDFKPNFPLKTRRAIGTRLVHKKKNTPKRLHCGECAPKFCQTADYGHLKVDQEESLKWKPMQNGSN